MYYAHCTSCKKYDSGEHETIHKLRERVSEDGGTLNKFESQCPECGEYDTLEMNES